MKSLAIVPYPPGAHDPSTPAFKSGCVPIGVVCPLSCQKARQRFECLMIATKPDSVPMQIYQLTLLYLELVHFARATSVNLAGLIFSKLDLLATGSPMAA